MTARENELLWAIHVLRSSTDLAAVLAGKTLREEIERLQAELAFEHSRSEEIARDRDASRKEADTEHAAEIGQLKADSDEDAATIEQLEKELSALKSQLLTLALQPRYVYQQIPVYQPYYVPYVQPFQPTIYPIITCTTPATGNFTIQCGSQNQ